MDPELLFDRGKPFYPFIMSFQTSTHGFIDLVSRRLVDLAKDDGVEDLIGIDPAFKVDRFKGAHKTPQFIDIELSGGSGPALKVDIADLEGEIFNEANYLTPFILAAPVRMLILACYEVSKDQPARKKDKTFEDPAWNFFYHIRNAAAHNGKFRIDRPITSASPAKWRNKEVTDAMQGTPLLEIEAGKRPFLQAADVMRFLHDIEKTLKPIQVN